MESKESNKRRENSNSVRLADVKETRTYRLRLEQHDFNDRCVSRSSVLPSIPSIQPNRAKRTLGRQSSKDDIDICRTRKTNNHNDDILENVSVDDHAFNKSSKLPTLNGNADLVFSGPCLVWKRDFRCDIAIFEHADLHIYEVIPIDLDKKKELNRIYLSIIDVNAVIEESIDVAKLRKQEIKRREYIKEARRNCAVDLIVSSLTVETEHVDAISSRTKISCWRYNPAISKRVDITVPKPQLLIPAKYTHKFRNAIRRRHVETVLQDLEDSKGSLCALSDTAEKHCNGVSEALQEAERSATSSVSSISETVNPRWVVWRVKWQWAIRQVILKNRIARCIGSAWARAIYVRQNEDAKVVKASLVESQFERVQKEGKFRKNAPKERTYFSDAACLGDLFDKMKKGANGKLPQKRCYAKNSPDTLPFQFTAGKQRISIK
mmetsp:Transcript_25437/g.37501  ORF Transcript_25437/g.37501 Transcript_25437/m.37501 type:complete len:436 (+) Transcript_25437:115-1422(+)|eukprot:CAMPEP_0185030832 /NCGR_PEP_ID=MMETSP1103-20130426/17917_1 /TAXON_ID=36769 /ORGANISM="Paraphysomonas bandaiensis, Strain Caron Lab Isolate" /LENGTH=435 /DNA_ID=CAMNT_0027566103 /DNA_START=43 /DNA_END=1350 /DNA_ORIENTATION=+